MATQAAQQVNQAGLSRADYKGAPSTLCQGCGHNGIASQITSALYELNVVPETVVKFSGIGCSSKSPTYFLSRSFAFNGVHGRMPSLALGALFGDARLHGIGVSGDGDTASIGMGQFKHIVRRNMPMVYIVENNGVYGLTKGQFSATADKGSKSKRGVVNNDTPIDLVTLALQLGATYVGRSFSGDKEQLVPLIKGAMRHRGPALIDVISPCVTFNNHQGSTKSYDYVREHNEAVNRLEVILARDPIETSYAPGSLRRVVQHDGSVLLLRKLGLDYDPTDRIGAMTHLHERAALGEIATGLLFVDEGAEEMHRHLNTVETPLNQLTDADLCPGSSVLETINASLR